MKNTAIIRRPNYAACRRRAYIKVNSSPFPNAADPHYFIDKLVDGALAVVTSLGTLTILFFLILL